MVAPQRRKDPCLFVPGQNLRDFASKLLSSQFVEASGEWVSTPSVITPVDRASCSSRMLPCAPCFESHLAIGLTDNQLSVRPAASDTGTITEVHHFRLNASIATKSCVTKAPHVMPSSPPQSLTVACIVQT